MGRKTPPCNLYPEWTQARFKTFVKSGLRGISMRWPPAQEVLKKNRRPYTGSDKRTKWEYQCNHCKDWFKMKEIKRDHITPVGGFSDNFENWAEDLGKIAQRMFCSVDGFQLLCEPCHKIVTDKERETGVWKR